MQFLGLQPITGVAGCCERAASGQAAAPPTMVMNSRRLTGSSSGREPRPYHIIEQTAKVLRVGLVGVQPRDAAIYVAFRKRMVELGYREDRYFTFEYIQTPSIDAYARQPVRYRLCFSPSTSIPSKEVTWPAWPDLAATSPESSSTRSNWRQNASNWCVMLCRKRATSGSSINPIGRRRREADHRG